MKLTCLSPALALNISGAPGGAEEKQRPLLFVQCVINNAPVSYMMTIDAIIGIMFCYATLFNGLHVFTLQLRRSLYITVKWLQMIA